MIAITILIQEHEKGVKVTGRGISVTPATKSEGDLAEKIFQILTQVELEGTARIDEVPVTIFRRRRK